jgi:hypothetical protein
MEKNRLNAPTSWVYFDLTSQNPFVVEINKLDLKNQIQTNKNELMKYDVQLK